MYMFIMDQFFDFIKNVQASSSGDGTIKVWSIKDKKSIHTWSNVVPKANSFFTAKVYGTPSFETQNGKYLAYPHGKEVIVAERSTWRESFRLKSANIKNVNFVLI